MGPVESTTSPRSDLDPANLGDPVAPSGNSSPRLPSTGSAADDDAVLGELRALNARFIHNFVTNDVASHDDLLHEAFVCVSSTGARVERDVYLRRWATLFDPEVIVYWDTRDERIDVVGSTALVRATNKWVERHGGDETTGMTTYTDTYVHDGGAWKCIQAQLTDVAAEHWPPDDTVISVYLAGVKQP